VIAAHTVFVDVDDMQVRFLQIWIRLHTWLKLYFVDTRLLKLLCSRAVKHESNEQTHGSYSMYPCGMQEESTAAR
jgi:hypothetical protein